MDPRVSLAYVFILCIAVFTVSATKERIDDEVSVLAKRLYDEIKKRLNDYGDKVDGLQDVDMSKFALQNETIIKTTSSLNRGAKFLNNSIVESREECAKLCSTNVQCNIAVFHNKKSYSCYLFNCGAPSVCEFSSHPDYVTMGLPQRNTGLSQQKKHESDLANLPASVTSVSTTTTTTEGTTTSPSTSSTTTTTASTTTMTTTKVDPKINKVQVSLFGKCGPLVGVCTDHFTECLTGICVCKVGYHEQEGACIPKEGDKLTDEHKNVPKEGDKLTDEHKNGNEKTDKMKELRPSIGDKTTVSPIKAITTSPVKTSSDSGEVPKVQGSSKNNTTSTTSDDKKKVQHSKNVTTTDDTVQSDTHKTAAAVPTIVEKTKEVVIIHEQGVGTTVVHQKAKSDRGAVVALGLGLAVTAILLLFVGCRLRNMKRKLRRGRPMNSNEADYLINGMYL